MTDRAEYLEYLHRYWAQQKAVGMIAEARFLNHLESTNVEPVSEVMLFQPKPENDEFQPWENIYTFILDAAEKDNLSQGQIEAARLMENAGTTVIFPLWKKAINQTLRVSEEDQEIHRLNTI